MRGGVDTVAIEQVITGLAAVGALASAITAIFAYRVGRQARDTA